MRPLWPGLCAAPEVLNPRTLFDQRSHSLQIVSAETLRTKVKYSKISGHVLYLDPGIMYVQKHAHFEIPFLGGQTKLPTIQLVVELTPLIPNTSDYQA